MFTINNPTAKPGIEGSKYAVWQLEQGNEGTKHYQGYIEFSNKKSFKQVKAVVGQNAHIEFRKGSRAQARDYCMNQGDFKDKEGQLEQPEEHGTWKNKGQRTDLEELAARVKKRKISELAEESPGLYVRYYRGLKALKAV